MTREGLCNYCKASILWLPTATTKMPVNATPDPDRGNVVVVGGLAGVLGPARARAARTAGETLYLPHVATCPHKAAWNKPKPKGRPAPRKAVRRR